jgi:hypothetical protein
VTTPIGTIGAIGAATLRGRRPITAPACHDLPELIEGDPATVWTWWQFDAPEARDPDETQADYLTRLGLLLPAETIPSLEAEQ